MTLHEHGSESQCDGSEDSRGEECYCVTNYPISNGGSTMTRDRMLAGYLHLRKQAAVAPSNVIR